MIGMVGGTVIRGWGWCDVGACMGGVYVLYMRLGLIGWSAGVEEEVVRYNWLVGKLIIPPCVCKKSIPNTTDKKDISCNNKLHLKCVVINSNGQ